MRWTRWVGMLACLLLIVASFLPWAWYPDLEKYFTGFYTEKNYYGKPGRVFIFFAAMGIAAYAFPRIWTQRLNLLFAALCMAFAIRTILLYLTAYDGFVPQPRPGIYLMLGAAILHLVMAFLYLTVVPRKDAKPATAA